MPGILWIRLYRTKFDDTGIADVTHPADDVEGAKKVAARRLESYVKEPRPNCRPVYAVIIDMGHREIAKFQWGLDCKVHELREV